MSLTIPFDLILKISMRLDRNPCSETHQIIFYAFKNQDFHLPYRSSMKSQTHLETLQDLQILQIIHLRYYHSLIFIYNFDFGLHYLIFSLHFNHHYPNLNQTQLFFSFKTMSFEIFGLHLSAMNMNL